MVVDVVMVAALMLAVWRMDVVVVAVVALMVDVVVGMGAIVMGDIGWWRLTVIERRVFKCVVRTVVVSRSIVTLLPF